MTETSTTVSIRCSRSSHRFFPTSQPLFRAVAFIILTSTLGIVGVAAPSLQLGVNWPEMARIRSWAVSESSGIVKSRTHKDIYWTHNDGGHSPRLFAIKLTGEVVAAVPVHGATNVDWEDIAIDDAGFIYVGDIGNNHAKHATRTIYRIPEPDPFAQPTKAVRPGAFLEYGYSDKRFNSEALFVRGSKPYVISKTTLTRPTLFEIKAGDSGKAVAIPLCRLPVGNVTAADLSTDGKKLAICGYGRLWVFDVGDDLSKLQDAKPRCVRFPYHYQIEACAFDDDDVILTAESRQIWRITKSDIEHERTLPKEDE